MGKAKMSKEEMKAEALGRMQKLGIYQPIVKDFEERGLVSVSEPPHGAWYWLDEEEQKQVKEWEDEHDSLVYCVVRSFTNFGIMDSYLYVSKYKQDWQSERPKKSGVVFAYVRNLTYPDCSEFGSVMIRTTIAQGLERIL